MQRWQWGHGPPSSTGMELGLQLLEGKSLGSGLCWQPPGATLPKHTRSSPGQAATRHDPTCRPTSEHLLNTSSPPSLFPKASSAVPGGAAPLYCPRPRAPRLPSSSCCHKPRLRGDVRLLSANSRGYCCRRGAGPTLIKQPGAPDLGSSAAVPLTQAGRSQGWQSGAPGSTCRVCCSLLNAPLLSSPGCIKFRLLSPGIKRLEVVAGRPAVPGREELRRS